MSDKLQLGEATLLALAREKLGYSAGSVEEAIEWAGESIAGLMETVKARNAEIARLGEERDKWEGAFERSDQTVDYLIAQLHRFREALGVPQPVKPTRWAEITTQALGKFDALRAELKAAQKENEQLRGFDDQVEFLTAALEDCRTARYAASDDLDAMRAELARLHKALDEIRHIALTTSTTDPAILRAIALIESTAAKADTPATPERETTEAK